MGVFRKTKSKKFKPIVDRGRVSSNSFYFVYHFQGDAAGVYSVYGGITLNRLFPSRYYLVYPVREVY
ncbi:hypothetical protein SAMN05660236_3954 [Ohtaekwangia koreensis]|uniref:Uncharacterized protein n=1 Tax=Ohtaekwangia koreensis TaxID=688867 RepID=A0A1T5LZP6_9BACT|nr:hypothetical protein SAMN05660236_3954 [Ohtaekwangia koreensis]